MTVAGIIAVLLLVAVFFFIRASRAFFWESYFRGSVHVLIGVFLVLAAAAVGFLGVTLGTYELVKEEQHAVEVQLVRKGDREYTAMLTYPGTRIQVVELRGDEWQIDARVLKWKGLAYLLGFDTVYRLDRIGGRYTKIEDEQKAPRTVHALNPPERIDTWELARKVNQWLPWVDAGYGSATFVPLADGALYEVRVSSSGLLARPANEAARKAVGAWKPPS